MEMVVERQGDPRAERKGSNDGLMEDIKRETSTGTHNEIQGAIHIGGNGNSGRNNGSESSNRHWSKCMF